MIKFIALAILIPTLCSSQEILSEKIKLPRITSKDTNLKLQKNLLKPKEKEDLPYEEEETILDNFSIKKIRPGYQGEYYLEIGINQKNVDKVEDDKDFDEYEEESLGYKN